MLLESSNRLLIEGLLGESPADDTAVFQIQHLQPQGDLSCPGDWFDSLLRMLHERLQSSIDLQPGCQRNLGQPVVLIDHLQFDEWWCEKHVLCDLDVCPGVLALATTERMLEYETLSSLVFEHGMFQVLQLA